jgi:oligo-alginate lyase
MNCVYLRPAVLLILLVVSPESGWSSHPRLLFSREEIENVKHRAEHPQLKSVKQRLLKQAEALLTAPPLLVSLTGRGEPDNPGELKGLEAARRLQGRVLTYCLSFTLTGEQKFREAAFREMIHALTQWKIWVDTAHPEPFDLMTGESCMTFGLAYDWLYDDLNPEDRTLIQEGAERRGLSTYIQGATSSPPMMWFTAKHNWNPVCNGGAAVLALALTGESSLSEKVLELAVPAMKRYWGQLATDGGWDEGTGYWTYGHRYGLLAAEALRRSGRPEGQAVFDKEGVRNTAYFPMIFNPGTRLAAGFGDSNHRASDPIFYLLGREYQNPDFIWFQDRESRNSEEGEGWPQDALAILWRPVGEPWLPEAKPEFTPRLESFSVFPSIGWAMMAPSQPDPPFFLVFKNGSLAANHTHLDLNHLSVGVGDTLLLTELGSRPYPADYFHRDKRNQYYEISTAGHNTLLVGGKGQILGKKGSLLDINKGHDYESLTGVADGVYEVATPRAHRLVVFVKKRYWVLLDEIETAEPQPVELRFHTYGRIVGMAKIRGWTMEQESASLDVIPLFPRQVSTTVEQPSGWIRPVQVLSMKSRQKKSLYLLATVLYPRTGSERGVARANARRYGKILKISVDQDKISLHQTEGGWGIQRVE